MSRGATMAVMETTTDITCQVRAIEPEVLARLRVRDDAGRPPRVVVDEEGGSPLRCCLRRIRPGERVGLVGYAPLRRWAEQTGARPGPYEETGPVFIHLEPCPGFSGTGLPPELSGGRQVCRAYDADGGIVDGLLADPRHPDAEPSVGRALAALFADPRTAVVHVRAVEYGCFTYEVRRAGA